MSRGVDEVLARMTRLFHEPLPHSITRNHTQEMFDGRRGLKFCHLFVVKALDEFTRDACFRGERAHRGFVGSFPYSARS